LRNKQKAQLGELLLATSAADSLAPDALASLLLHGLEQAKDNSQATESWRRRGETFFRREQAGAGGFGESKPAAAPARAAHRDTEDAGRAAVE
jgi:hypothetical protein